MNKVEEKVQRVRLNLSIAYLESYDLIERLSEHKELIGLFDLKHETKKAATRYFKELDKFMKQLESFNNHITDESKEDDNDNYSDVLNDMPKAVQRLEKQLIKIIKKEK